MVNQRQQVISLKHFLLAANFLQYSDSLKVVRAESGVLNATSNGTGLLIRDDDHYQTSFADGQGTVVNGGSRTAGTHGTAIGVSICTSATAYEQNLT